MHHAVYNSRIAGMLTPSSPRWVRSVFILPILLLAATASGQNGTGANWTGANWTGAEEQLATKIVAVTGARTMAVEVVNRSSLNSASADDIRRGLLTELASKGGRFVTAEQAAARVRVSLSEDLQSYVWVAEILLSASETSVVMISLPRPATPVVEPQAWSMVLQKTLLWSQPEHILDVAVIEGNPARLLVLDSNGVTSYRLQDGRWQPEQPLPITHSKPWPRDLRGRLALRKDHLFDAYLPGVSCRSTAGAPVAITCYEGDGDGANSWPIGSDQAGLNAPFTPLRNFFSGALSAPLGKQASAPPFYSAAALQRDLQRDKDTWWLFATVDGRIHLLDGSTDQAVASPGWGSDIASVHSGCGTGGQVLATGAGEAPNDSIRAFEIPARDPVAVSAPLEISGRVTAFWTESSGSSAVAVVRNSDTGGYEAFRLTVTCGR
jgi:hypothetical protein